MTGSGLLYLQSKLPAVGTVFTTHATILGRSLDVFISRLRKYLKDDPRIKIENILGVGFKFKVEE